MIRFEDEKEETAEENSKPKKSMMERLLETRTITIFGEINMKLAQEVTEKLGLPPVEIIDAVGRRHCLASDKWGAFLRILRRNHLKTR